MPSSTMPPSITAVVHHAVVHHTVIHSGGGIGIQVFGELDVGEADILDGLDGDGEAVLRLAGHEGVFGVSTGDHAAVVVVHGDNGGNGATPFSPEAVMDTLSTMPT